MLSLRYSTVRYTVYCHFSIVWVYVSFHLCVSTLSSSNYNSLLSTCSHWDPLVRLSRCLLAHLSLPHRSSLLHTLLPLRPDRNRGRQSERFSVLAVMWKWQSCFEKTCLRKKQTRVNMCCWHIKVVKHEYSYQWQQRLVFTSSFWPWTYQLITCKCLQVITHSIYFWCCSWAVLHHPFSSSTAPPVPSWSHSVTAAVQITQSTTASWLWCHSLQLPCWYRSATWLKWA